jgi:hypothetical protein
MTELLDANRKLHGGIDKYALLVFTNHPHHYGTPEEVDPQKHTIAINPMRGPNVSHPDAIRDLRWGVTLYGQIPQHFPTRHKVASA